MKNIEELKEILDKRNEYTVALYEEKAKHEEQLKQVKEEYEDLQKKMVLIPSMKNKTKLEEKRKQLKEAEEKFQNIEHDIKEFEVGVLDIAPYRQSIIDEYSQEVMANTEAQLERLKKATQEYEDAAAELTEAVRNNIQLRSNILLILYKAKPEREIIEETERGFALNERNSKINQYIDDQISRIQSQLSPCRPGKIERDEIETKSVFHYDFLGNLI